MKVVLLPKHCLNTAKKELNIIRLRHPRTDAAALYLHNPDVNLLHELMEFKEPNRSWFINDTNEPDGALIIGSPIDSLFLILPYLYHQSKNFCPLDDLIHDEDFPHVTHLLACCQSSALANISINKDIGKMQVYKFSKENTMNWLQRKVQNVVHVLKSKKLDVSVGSRLSTFVDASVQADENAYLHYAFKLVDEYLPEELSEELLASLGLNKNTESQSKGSRSAGSPSKAEAESPLKKNDASPSRKNKRKASCEGSPNAKKRASEPLEDYSSYGQKYAEDLKAKNKKLSVAQKQLQKVNKKGMKNISTFFTNTKK